MDWYTKLDQQLTELLPDLRCLRDEPMRRHTSFHIGGPAKRLACPENGEQLVLLMHLAQACGARPLVIGNGTNLLVPDTGLDRLVVDTSAAMHALCLEEDGAIHAAAGVSLARLADFACKQGLAGLEFAHGIPGTLGGAVCMNAGAYGGEMSQVLTSVTALIPEEGIRSLSLPELALGYRRSFFTAHPEAVVLDARIRLQPGDPVAIRARMNDLMARRKEKQPLDFPSAGSTFKRPEGFFAGALIEQCGLKGFTVGGAQVSEKHAGFVINTGDATFADVTALIAKVQRRVLAETGVVLEPEVRIVEG